MKALKHFTLCLFLAVVAFGCNSDKVTPKNEANNALGSYVPVPRPLQQCGPSAFSRMKDGGSDLGGVEILNSSTHLYMVFDMNQNKFLEELKVFTGELNNLPLDADGNVSVEEFGYQSNLGQPVNEYTLMLPLATTPMCNDMLIWARVTTRSLFGNITATNYVWMSGAPVANGFSLNYCAPSCSSGSNGSNSAVD